MAERQNHPITDAIRIRTRRSQDPERGVAGNWRAAPLPLSIPTLAASVIGAPAVFAMLALRALDLVRFSPVALFPPRTVRVATMGLDKAARRYQHTCCDHGKTQASHNCSSPPDLDIQIISRGQRAHRRCRRKWKTKTFLPQPVANIHLSSGIHADLIPVNT